MNDPLDIFTKIGKSLVVDAEEFVSFCLRLQKPSSLEYIINGFLRQERHMDKDLFNRKLKLLHGVESNYTYQMYGDVYDPIEFKSLKCEVMVNPLGGSDYLEYFKNGYAGDGWFENDRLVFRLYVPSQMAKDIIDRRLLAEEIVDYFEYKDDQLVWMGLRFDISNYKYAGGIFAEKQRVCFNIVRVYC